MRIAILPTWTMDVIYIRALTPTFSWGEPHNGGLSTTWPTNKTLSYALLWIILESCLSARLRASSRVHSQCTQPSSFITGSVQYGCDLWLHILGKQKSRSMKLYDRRIGFLFCGILTVCTARIFFVKCSTALNRCAVVYESLLRCAFSLDSAHRTQ